MEIRKQQARAAEWSRKQRKAKVVNYLQPKAGHSREGEVKEHLTCEARGRIWTWDFWSTADCFDHLATADCFDHLATVSFRREMEYATVITNLPTLLFYCTYVRPWCQRCHNWLHGRGIVTSKILQPFLLGLQMILRFAVCTDVVPVMLGKCKWGSLTLCIAGIRGSMF